MTLAEFLLARIADDEMVAQDAAKYGAPKWDEDNAQCWTLDGQKHIPMTEAESRHVGRFDPARVLAECEAKRRIVEMHSDGRAELRYPGDGLDDEDDYLPARCVRCTVEHEGEPWPCETLRLLALPYSSHPDYDEAWKP